MGRTADWSRRPNLTQHILQMVGERVVEYNSKTGNQKMNPAMTELVPSSRSENDVSKDSQT